MVAPREKRGVREASFHNRKGGSKPQPWKWVPCGKRKLSVNRLATSEGRISIAARQRHCAIITSGCQVEVRACSAKQGGCALKLCLELGCFAESGNSSFGKILRRKNPHSRKAASLCHYHIVLSSDFRRRISFACFLAKNMVDHCLGVSCPHSLLTTRN